MTISKTDLLARVKSSLTSSYKLLVPDEENTTVLDVIVNNALAALTQKAPVTSIDTIVLQPNVQVYPAPADMWDYKETSWGTFQNVQPWDPGFISRIPVIEYENGSLHFSFAPSAVMLSSLGSRFTYFYFARYLEDEESGHLNVEPRKQPLLLLLCLMEAMKILILRSPGSQITAKPGLSKIQYSSPHIAYDALSKEADNLAAAL